MQNRRVRQALIGLSLFLGTVTIVLSLASYWIGSINHLSWGEMFVDAGPIIGITFAPVGMLIAYHRPRHRMGWIYLTIGFSQGVGYFTNQYATYALVTQPGSLPLANLMSVISQTMWMPGLQLMLTYGLLWFPDGKVPSPGWRFLEWLSAVPPLMSVVLFASNLPNGGREFLLTPEVFTPPHGSLLSIIYTVFFPLILICGLLSVASLIFRFHHARGKERAQIKWLTFAAAVTFTFIFLGNTVLTGTSFIPLTLLVVPTIPLAAGIAILRHRLFNIDLIIRRTLLYGALTALLAAVYYGSVVLLQEVFHALTGQTNAAAIVISTLVIAALFTPLRRALQRGIDRRFFREQYDAERTLAAFRAQVRASVDVDRLSAGLVSAVEETLQPEKTLLWLRKGAEQQDHPG